MYAWSSRNRLTPMRMIWSASMKNPNSFVFELIKWRKRGLRASRIDVRRYTRVEMDRYQRRAYPQAADGARWWTRRPIR
jgi:hypothetical protein